MSLRKIQQQEKKIEIRRKEGKEEGREERETFINYD